MRAFFFSLFLTLLAFFTFGVKAQECTGDLNQRISCYESNLTKLGNSSKTLSSQIYQFDAQIRLTTLKITQTEEQISLLSGRIDQLEGSLGSLTSAYSERVVETYKMGRVGDPFFLLISSSNLSEVFSRYSYLKKIQEADKGLLQRLQKVQDTYKEEKVSQEDLQAKLETQQKQLNSQKLSKAKLLEITKNDEKKYQSLLAKARAELEAIQSILVGRGQEIESGKIDEGSRIASIISGASPCSSGGHLHFEVVKDKNHQNPASFLSSRSVIWDNSPDSPFSFTGSWQWPINEPIRITQGYGMTYYAAKLNYYNGAPHTGVDMINISDYTVKAVKPGVLYKGAIACGGGTLRYVRVKQDDGYDTYYLHINY
ncbi:hypothetical protein A2422_02795 [Candidatus Woesebacteria bacterium RIFOXYC1_FULL_31_51]|uniref:Cell wall-associated hydrolase n=1 Tax=Candidatus Woesebacteria bacterium GW2011_GWC2_31_9 TaxID=1618586 RepID=A0A0F9YHP8_9BACT|nr:MAG: Cell wall-associated hydrolase [Candidatus Woesebacteria bacterium GW2011_GWF1_31_35]KKP23439.1 MAG: Cell wall-associated hydrolase [Candidatus Woesebacteria bacterium GW2011_GWC1_30_29]KKP26416.1 MAG: Cell wall-associated hydrolase [Candidatus Woesebacteria bacterium GW2011_GWD1_31_12]KKP27715.1 MAG: Cell wall-associated hydrolase [Candidatus Woesebacteria bacterium GW2011_GWB1_31_29]KKP30933.1 MAG: Cell wall-associated hydrolase [Candidatus Woesebacteria bacterium GW2011_GWC2_31_9]KK